MKSELFSSRNTSAAQVHFKEFTGDIHVASYVRNKMLIASRHTQRPLPTIMGVGKGRHTTVDTLNLPNPNSRVIVVLQNYQKTWMAALPAISELLEAGGDQYMYVC